MARYLADTSIWAWAKKSSRPDIRDKLAQRVAADEVVTCIPVALEVMHAPDTSGTYARQFTTLLEPLDWLALTEQASERAMEVQRLLAATSNGAHRRPPVDYLIAAIAEQHEDIILWCFDKDYNMIAAQTKQPIEQEASTGPGH